MEIILKDVIDAGTLDNPSFSSEQESLESDLTLDLTLSNLDSDNNKIYLNIEDHIYIIDRAKLALALKTLFEYKGLSLQKELDEEELDEIYEKYKRN